MSLTATLVGVLAGAGVNGFAQFAWQRRDEATDRRAACRVLDDELLYTRYELQDARNKGEAAALGDVVAAVLSVVFDAAGWERHRMLLARRLPRHEWESLLAVYSSLALLKVRLSVPRAWYTQLNDLLDAVDTARSVLLRYAGRDSNDLGRWRRP